MDAAASEVMSVVKCQSLPDEQPSTPPKQTLERKSRKCYEEPSQGQFPLASNPTVLLHILSNYGIDGETLARLEATCTFFRRPAQIDPDTSLSMPEVAALDMCNKRAIFGPMIDEEREGLKQMCGGSWKLVLRFLLAGEVCARREKPLAVAGPGHSIALTRNGDVYSFGSNRFGELGNGTTKNVLRPSLIRSLQDIRIIHASPGLGTTILISDAGRVYTLGKNGSGKSSSMPKLVESLKDIFVVQAAFGHFFTAFLSREGKVYTVGWGRDDRLGHDTDPEDFEPRPLLGALENVPVVQIAAGQCFLLALAWKPGGMSVYSIGCGLGGKLGHGTTDDETNPRLIEEFQTLNFQPKVIATGPWHSAAVAADGRVCTWGWGKFGCLGHGDEEHQVYPKVVEGLANVKAVHVAAGEYTTFVVSDDGDVYSFGYGWPSLGHIPEDDQQQGMGRPSFLTPVLVTSLKKLNERIVHISATKLIFSKPHTFALTGSGKLYTFGAGGSGQLGINVLHNYQEMLIPGLVNIDLS